MPLTIETINESNNERQNQQKDHIRLQLIKG